MLSTDLVQVLCRLSHIPSLFLPFSQVFDLSNQKLSSIVVLPILSPVAMATSAFLWLVSARVYSSSLFFFFLNFQPFLDLFTADIFLVNNIWLVLLVWKYFFV